MSSRWERLCVVFSGGVLLACSDVGTDALGSTGTAGRGGAPSGSAGFPSGGAGFGGPASGGSHSAGSGGAGSGGSNTAGAGGSNTAGAGGSNTAGAGGSLTAGGGGTSPAGQAGAGGDPVVPPPVACGDVPRDGECVGNTLRFCQQAFVVSSADGSEEMRPPRLIERICDAGFSCLASAEGASCRPSTACTPGKTACAPGGAGLAVCDMDGATFATTACAATHTCETGAEGVASCVPRPASEHVLSGCVTFERRDLIATGIGEIFVDVAAGVTVSVSDGPAPSSLASLGVGSTDERGCFVIPLTEKPSANAVVHVAALGFGKSAASPTLAVVHAEDLQSSLPKSSPGYWLWSNRDTACANGASIQAPIQLDALGPGRHRLGTVDHDASKHPGPDLLVPEACGSGALAIYDVARQAQLRVGRDHGELGGLLGETLPATESLPAPSRMILWEPGRDVPCGACFSQQSNGPFEVLRDGQPPDAFDTATYVSGSMHNATHWSRSVVALESALWIMSAYSQTPGEGGVLHVTQATKPGLAYATGWATAFGQLLLSRPSAGFWDARYVDHQDGSTFVVDLGTLTYGGVGKPGMPIPKADETGALDQLVNHNVVASLVFRLAANDTQIASSRGLGLDAIGRALVDPRISTNAIQRGYVRVDLLDFLDAGRCSGAFSEGDIVAVTGALSFPWDGKPRCQ